jgi:20S proteasome alpha/beta subunit
VTAIIGFSCFDGVLMMSDTEESTSQYTKSDADKLYRMISPSVIAISAGSGNAHLVDCANFELLKLFGQTLPKSKVKLTPQIVHDRLNKFARQFLTETMAGYSSGGLLPPDFQLLIAVNILKKRTMLFKLEKNRVLLVRSPRHECIGAGAEVIHPMLRYYETELTKETALFCGIRMMNRAKRTILGVGGKTEAQALLHNGTTVAFGTANTAQIEELVANLDEFQEKFVLATIANVSTEFAETEGNCVDAIESFPERYKDYRERYKELLAKPVY